MTHGDDNTARDGAMIVEEMEGQGVGLTILLDNINAGDGTVDGGMDCEEQEPGFNGTNDGSPTVVAEEAAAAAVATEGQLLLVDCCLRRASSSEHYIIQLDNLNSQISIIIY